MLIEQLRKFKIILNSVQATTVSPSVLQKVLQLAGFHLDLSFVPIITQVIQARGSGKTLFDLIEDEQLMVEVEALLNMNNKKLTSNCDDSESILLTSAIRCPHCNLPFAIIDAPGVIDKIQSKDDINGTISNDS